jgi:hypothetical protein
MIYILLRLRRVLCQNMPELIKAKSEEKNWPAKKSRRREDRDDFIKGIAARQTQKRPNQKRPASQSLTRRVFPKKRLPILHNLRIQGALSPVTEEGVSSRIGKVDVFG